LDDETDYSAFEALMAYSRGFRVHAIGSWTEAERLLGRRGVYTPPQASAGSEGVPSTAAPTEPGPEFLLSLEDWYLNLADQEVHHLSDLKYRDEVLPALKDAPELRRRFITVGHWYGRSLDPGVQMSYLAVRRGKES